MANKTTIAPDALLRGGISTLDDLVNAVRDDLKSKISNEASELVSKAAYLASRAIEFNDYRGSEIKGIRASGLEVPYNFVADAPAILKQADSSRRDMFYAELEKNLDALLGENERSKLKRIEGALDSIKKHAVEYAAYRAATRPNDDNSSEVEDLSVIRYFSKGSEIPKFYIIKGAQSESYFNALVASALSDMPILAYGPTGIAKTLAVNYLAAAWNSRTMPVPHAPIIPLITLQCSSDSDAYSLIGHEIIENGAVKFQKGPLPMAIEAANNNGVAILLIDEIAALNPETQKLLNPLLDGVKAVIFGEKAWHLDPDARLIMVATTNIAGDMGYGGINKMNEDLWRRFPVKKKLDFPGKDEEKGILGHFTKDNTLIEALIKLAEHTRSPNSNIKPLSTATLVNAIELIHSYQEMLADQQKTFNAAITEAIVDSYTEVEDREAIIEKIKDILPNYKKEGLERLKGIKEAIESIKGYAKGYAATHKDSIESNDGSLKDLSVIVDFSKDTKAAIPEYSIVDGGQSEEYFNSLVAASFSGKPMLVWGPTGIAKTLAVNYLAAMLSAPIVTAQCTADSDAYSLIGHEIIENGAVKFQKGPLPMAIEAANNNGVAILLIDEIAALNPETQKLLNPLLDGVKAVIFGEKAWHLDPDAKLIIVATTNIAGNRGYGGINKVNEDLWRRFIIKKALSFPEKEEEKKILERHFKGNLTDEGSKLIDDLIKVAEYTRKPDSGIMPLSTATLANTVRVIPAYQEAFVNQSLAFEEAINNTIVNEYPENEDRDEVLKIVKGTFSNYGKKPSGKKDGTSAGADNSFIDSA